MQNCCSQEGSPKQTSARHIITKRRGYWDAVIIVEAQSFSAALAVNGRLALIAMTSRKITNLLGTAIALIVAADNAQERDAKYALYALFNISKIGTILSELSYLPCKVLL